MLCIYVFTSSTSGAAVSLMFNIYIYYLLPFKKKMNHTFFPILVHTILFSNFPVYQSLNSIVSSFCDFC